MSNRIPEITLPELEALYYVSRVDDTDKPKEPIEDAVELMEYERGLPKLFSTKTNKIRLSPVIIRGINFAPATIIYFMENPEELPTEATPYERVTETDLDELYFVMEHNGDHLIARSTGLVVKANLITPVIGKRPITRNGIIRKLKALKARTDLECSIEKATEDQITIDKLELRVSHLERKYTALLKRFGLADEDL